MAIGFVQYRTVTILCLDHDFEAQLETELINFGTFELSKKLFVCI